MIVRIKPFCTWEELTTRLAEIINQDQDEECPMTKAFEDEFEGDE